jgi:tRNA A37 methylthiotransferase MiaB
MSDQVDEPTKKARAAALLAVAADARQRWAHGRVGGLADVLFETRLEDGRWAGHATDHTLVAVTLDRPELDFENVIGRVAIDAVDPTRRDRVVGRILSASPPRNPMLPRTPTPGAPVHAG